MYKNVVVFISGNGSNLQKLIDTVHHSKIDIKLVVSNRKSAYGLKRAEEADIPTLYMPYLSKTMDRIDYDLSVGKEVLRRVPDLDFVFFLGWMHILSEDFIHLFPPKTLINLHPALPGCFPGKDALLEAYNYFKENPSKEMETGAMVHYVIPEIDAGEVIEKIHIPIYVTDTLETLRYRMFHMEKEVLLRAIKKIM
tara:strand:- start:56 stop:643 length:588 start_codon:yes stop_codon:yes gene_type:complete